MASPARIMTDEELMLQAQSGDRNAFEQLVERHYDHLAFYIGNVLGAGELVEDLVQETFLRAFRARKRYVPRARWTTWVRKIALNLSLDEQRRKRFGVVYSLDDACTRAGIPERCSLYEVIPDCHTPAPDVSACANEEIDQFYAQLSNLTPKHSEVLRMRVQDNLNYREIADRLGCSLGTVKSRIHYAMRELRTRIEADAV